jgi:hypothetical protein
MYNLILFRGREERGNFPLPLQEEDWRAKIWKKIIHILAKK